MCVGGGGESVTKIYIDSPQRNRIYYPYVNDSPHSFPKFGNDGEKQV